MNVSLTEELEAMVQEKVRSGMYSSASEVVRDALRLLNERDRLRQVRLEELRREIAIGVEQAERGELEDADVEAFLREMKSSGKAVTDAPREADSGNQEGPHGDLGLHRRSKRRGSREGDSNSVQKLREVG